MDKERNTIYGIELGMIKTVLWVNGYAKCVLNIHERTGSRSLDAYQ